MRRIAQLKAMIKEVLDKGGSVSYEKLAQYCMTEWGSSKRTAREYVEVAQLQW